MRTRIGIGTAAVAAAALALAGCAAPATPTPVPTATIEPLPTATVAPEVTPTPTPTPSPTETSAPAPLDPAALVDAVVAKDAAAVVAQLGDPIREVDTLNGVDESRPASAVVGDLTAIIGVGENFKPGEVTDLGPAAMDHPEFAGADAVVLVGSLGTVLAFVPGGFLRVSP